MTGRVFGKVNAVVFRPVNIGCLKSLSNAPPRLPVWLRWANEARDSRIDAESLRHYYLILEDIISQKDPHFADTIYRIKLIRHFISHGKPLTNKEVLDSVGKYWATELSSAIHMMPN
jgi:hypothetical protein